MERTLVMIAPSSFKLEDVCRDLMREPGLTVTTNDEGDLDVRSSSDSARYVFVDLVPDRQLAIADYRDNDELDEGFRAAVGDKEFVVLLASSMDLLRRVAQRFVELWGPAACWVDDDYGHVVRGDHFLARLAAEPEWNLIAED